MRPTRVLTILMSLATALVTSLGVQPAQARVTYYTREDSVRCQNQTANTAIGAGVGGGVGALGGAAIASGARAVGALVGAGIGAVTGGLLGLGLSCEEEVRYVKNVDESIGDYRFPWWERPIERDNYRIIMLERGKNRYGESCSFYQVEFFGVNGRPYAVRETACRIAGVWRHFRYYEGDQPIIAVRHYVNPHARDQMRVAWVPTPNPMVHASVDIGPVAPAPQDYRYESAQRDLEREQQSLDYRYGQMRAGQMVSQ